MLSFLFTFSIAHLKMEQMTNFNRKIPVPVHSIRDKDDGKETWTNSKSLGDRGHDTFLMKLAL